MSRALVIGSGVAGPAVALFLQRAGWDVEIFEACRRARRLRRALPQRRHQRPRRARPARTPRADRRRGAPLAAHGHVVEHRQGARHGAERSGSRARARQRRGASRHPASRAARGRAAGRDPDHLRRAARAHRADGCLGARDLRRRAHRRPGDLLVGADGVGSPTRRHIDPDAPAPAYSRPRRVSAASPALPGSRPPPRRSTWCSADARSSATSCATTARCTGSRTSRIPPPIARRFEP